MTSKNSFLVRIKENSKRRLWVWIVSLLVFVMAWPSYILLTIRQIFSWEEQYVKAYGVAETQKLLRENLLKSMSRQLGLTEFIMIGAAVLALICAIQGFSWLYSQKKIDFYMGMPVKRKKRFFYIWLNGILIYLIPYLIGMLLGGLIAMANGGMNGEVFGSMLRAYGIGALYYLCVYHMAILAVMLTGNVLITLMGFGVFSLYEWFVIAILGQYQSTFFEYYTYYGKQESPVLSPFTMLYHLQYVSSGVSNLKYVAGMVAFAAVVGVLGYFCYLKRPAEAAGKAMTFSITKPFVKILIVVPAALCVGNSISEILGFQREKSGNEVGFILLAMAVAVILVSGLMQVIFEFDIRGALHKKWHMAASGLLTAFVFAVFYFDLFGYDSYVPNPNQVESVAFLPSENADVVNGNHVGYYDENGSYLSKEEYGEQHMFLTDIQTVCTLAQTSMESYDQQVLQANLDLAEAEAEDIGNWSLATLIYRMKSGRKVVRNIYVNVDDAQTETLLSDLMSSQEYKQGTLYGLSEELEQLLSEDKYQFTITYGNGIYKQKMSRQDLQEFLTIYREDVAGMTYSHTKESVPVGGIAIEFKEQETGSGNGYGVVYSYNYTGVNVYPFMEKSIAFLRERGYYYDFQLNPQDVESIHIINHNIEKRQEFYKEQGSTSGMAEAEAEIDTRMYADYTGEEEIRQIAENIYPETAVYEYSWQNGVKADRNYQVIVYFKPGSEVARNYEISAYYVFTTGQVPEFVQQDTKYVE